jgi:hypothetical protein
LRYWRFHHPHPLVQLKMEVVSVAERLTESFESASSPDDPAPMLS